MVTSVAMSHSSFVFWFLTDSFSDICKPAERRNMCGRVWKAQQRKCISPGSLFTADTSLQSFTYKMCLSTLDCVQRAQKISAIQSCKTLCTPQFLLSFPFLNFSVFLFHLTLLLHLLSLFPHSSAELSLPAYFSVFHMASPHPPWSLSLVQHFLLVSLVSLSRGFPPFFPSSFHFLNFSSSALFLTLPQICTLVIFSVSVFSVPLELFLLLPSASFPPALLLFTYPSAVTSASTHFLPLFHFLSPSFFSTHGKHKVCALGSTTTQKWNCTHAFRLIKL